MAKNQDFQATFEKLRAILKKYEKRLVLQSERPGYYYLNTGVQREDGYEYFFGAAAIKKNYVSYYLMPMGCPGLLEGMSPELRARMQGKACFNFKTIDRSLLTELSKLTKKGYEQFKRLGYA